MLRTALKTAAIACLALCTTMGSQAAFAAETGPLLRADPIGCPPPPAPGRTLRARHAATRTLLAEQRQCIADAVMRFAPRVAGRTNVYVVSFAGYGEQRVFRKEARLALRVFGERFGSLDRSLELANDIHDRTSYPLATYENLHYAVQLIARRMDPREDLLVLVLTSHGSPDAGIAITNGPLLDDDLSPRDVRNILDDAQIRWRVIVASACYAGIFVRPLATDSSLIMTAADSRHSSFGCADDRDLTYFGEALFGNAMPGACSLQDAFATAKRIIRRRESAEGEIHSNPQMFVGARMREKLASIEHVPEAFARERPLSCAKVAPHPRARGSMQQREANR